MNKSLRYQQSKPRMPRSKRPVVVIEMVGTVDGTNVVAGNLTPGDEKFILSHVTSQFIHILETTTLVNRLFDEPRKLSITFGQTIYCANDEAAILERECKKEYVQYSGRTSRPGDDCPVEMKGGIDRIDWLPHRDNMIPTKKEAAAKRKTVAEYVKDAAKDLPPGANRDRISHMYGGRNVGKTDAIIQSLVKDCNTLLTALKEINNFPKPSVLQREHNGRFEMSYQTALISTTTRMREIANTAIRVIFSTNHGIIKKP